MEVRTLGYTPQQGWTEPLPPLDSPDTLVLAFGASSLRSAGSLYTTLRTTYPASHLMGCSTSGEILGAKVSDDSLSLAVVRFQHTRLRRVGADITSAADSRGAALSMAEALDAPDLKAVFVLSDGLHVNGSELVRGFNERFGGRVIVTGGLAGDGARFKSTWVLSEGRPEESRAVAVGFYGDRIRVGHGSKGGWDTFGPERKITRAQGNVLHELDGRPALALYKDYLGDLASGLPATALLFPLALRLEEGEQRQLVRTVLAVDEASQTMTFAGDLPEGGLVQLMRANFDRLIGGAQEAAGRIGSLDAGPALCIAISCVGRRLVLGERTEEEVETTLQALPEGTSQVGFYSYGEISPFASGACDLHNQTMTLTVLQEV